MQGTDRLWAMVGLASALIGLSFLFDRPMLLMGALFIGIWLVTLQYQFFQSVFSSIDGLTIHQSVGDGRLVTGQETMITLEGHLDRSVNIDLTITSHPPVGTEGVGKEGLTIDIPAGELGKSSHTIATWSIARSVSFEKPTVTLKDQYGLFRESLKLGQSAEVDIEPRSPRNIHVGSGGTRLLGVFGEYPTDDRGTSGLEPEEIREYVPGDETKHIDWKATARFNHPHIREFQSQTDQANLILLDHRESMAHGLTGETKLDFAKEVALAFLLRAKRIGDPIGFYSVGDAGTINEIAPSNHPESFSNMQNVLDSLQPTEGIDSSPQQGLTSTEAGRLANRLDHNRSEYATVLKPFFENADPYIKRVEDKPLVESIRRYQTRGRDPIRTILLTDDSFPTEVRETVRRSARGEGHTLVFLTPSVLYSELGLANLDEAYAQYREFEEFRKQLSNHPRVSTFEIGPEDRINAILDRQSESRIKSKN